MTTREEIIERRERFAERLIRYLSPTAAVRAHAKEEGIGLGAAWKDHGSVMEAWREEGKEKIEDTRSKALQARYRLLRKILEEAEFCKYEVNRIAAFATALKVLDSIAKIGGLLEDIETPPSSFNVGFKLKVRGIIPEHKMKKIEAKVLPGPAEGKRNGSNGSNGRSR